MAAWQWAEEKNSKCFLALAQQTALASSGGTLPQVPDLLALITARKGTTMTTLNIPSPITADEKQDESKGMYRSKLNNILQMCGKDSTWDMMDLPAWMQECSTKGTSKHYKSIIIQKFLMSNWFYDDADVPLTSPLLNMIIKRAWTWKDVNINRPSLLYAMEGFSTFTMLDLSEDEVALLNNEYDLITSASLVSVADLRQQQKQKKSAFPLMQMSLW